MGGAARDGRDDGLAFGVQTRENPFQFWGAGGGWFYKKKRGMRMGMLTIMGGCADCVVRNLFVLGGGRGERH